VPLIDIYDYDPPKRRYDTPPSNPRVEYIGKSLETGAKHLCIIAPYGIPAKFRYRQKPE
jgi:hypothetical protein